ncbi:Uncharacterised protein [Serratia quinivorans]|nr:Uncharacterised protein [Serratia quinivorans]CAI0775886.1 Uncharacterised protein [Serratia quinivorans]CAI1684499.1 Uncharacterised protein [Serratia quinivorans]CAI2055362.1 Uncharacterised protein [Serratia quinivorans]CAI2103176.1 Uncharacterised protein [Serratia quinivorans]
MKLIKTLRPSVPYRSCHRQEQHHPDISILVLTDMGVSPRLRPEPELRQLASEELRLNSGVLDLIILKANLHLQNSTTTLGRYTTPSRSEILRFAP